VHAVNPTYLVTIITAVAALLGGVIALVAALGVTRATARQEAAERNRLNVEVLGSAGPLPTPELLAQVSPDIAGRLTRLAEKAVLLEDVRDAEQARLREEGSPAGESPSHEGTGARRDDVYDQLLINDYALGLTQARVAFNVSMAFSILGGLVLVIGIALAIFRADTGGQVAGAAITSAAGVLTSGLSQLFRGQSTKALKHLESQAVELRKDVRAQSNSTTAQSLLAQVADDDLRSRLQAALILEFTGAKLPDLERSSRPRTANQNGHAPAFQATQTDSSAS
jgi:hypothetical protein